MSQARIIAKRYVRAFFLLAQERRMHEDVKRDVILLREVLEKSDALQRLLHNPTLSRPRAAKAIGSLLSALRVSDLTQKFFIFLAEQRRLPLVALIVEGYLQMLAEQSGEQVVQVISATPLSIAAQADIAKLLAAKTKKRITLEAKEDAALLGGMQLHIGSTMVDASVQGALTRLKQTLKPKAA